MKVQGQDVEQQEQSALFLTNLAQPPTSPPNRRNSLQTTYGNIESWFEENARLANQRKQRAKQNRRRLQQIESQLIKRKEELSRSLQQKLSNSSKIRRKTIWRIKQRLNNTSERHQKISAKSKIQRQQSIKKTLQIRKSYVPQDQQFNSKLSRKSKTSQTGQRQLSFKKLAFDSNIDRMLQQYREKQQRAKNASQERKREAALRARSHNSIEVSSVKQRALFRKENELLLQSNEILNRLDQLNLVRRKKEQLIKQKNKKNKTFSQKLTRIKDNLQIIEEERNTKYTELASKLDRKVEKRSWRQRKTSINNRRLFQNLHAIERQQIAKADLIIQKHREIDQKYRFYKTKKDQLYNTCKNAEQ